MSKSQVDVIHESIDAMIDEVKSLAEQTREGTTNKPTAAQVEIHIFRRLLKIGLLFMLQYFAEVGSGDLGFRLKRNGVELRRRLRKPITLLTVFGVLEVDRWLYHARGEGCFSPTAEAASLPDRQASYFVQRLVARLGMRDTFEECVRFLDELFGFSLSTHTADEVIDELAANHRGFAEQLTPPPATSEETIQVVGFDGKGVPVVKEDPARRAARLAKGEKRNRKKEAMVGLEYVAAPKLRTPELLAQALVRPEALTDEERGQLHAARPAQDLYYQASLEVGREGLIREIFERAEERRQVTDHELEQVCLSDGAASQLRICENVFPDATIVLDIIHAMERFWNAAHLFHPEGSEAAKDMVHDLVLRTLQGKIGYVIGGLRQRATKQKLGKRRQKRLQAILTYLQNHRQFMHYDQYLARGFPISTGAVESACGHLVKDRMEKAGARWSIRGGEAMLRLRAIYASGNFDDYLEYHQQREHQRLYAPERAA